MVLISSEINRHQVIHRFILFMSNTVPLKGAICVFYPPFMSIQYVLASDRAG
jgi:hypothetical protein